LKQGFGIDQGNPSGLPVLLLQIVLAPHLMLFAKPDRTRQNPTLRGKTKSETNRMVFIYTQYLKGLRQSFVGIRIPTYEVLQGITVVRTSPGGSQGIKKDSFCYEY
jgi:hypothetical protein